MCAKATGCHGLAIGTRPGNVINSDADTEHTVMTGPAIDAAAVVADLNPLPGLVNGRHQMQVDRPGDARKDDVANIELRRIYRSDYDALSAVDDAPPAWGDPSKSVVFLEAKDASEAITPVQHFVAYGSDVGQPCDNPFCCG